MEETYQNEPAEEVIQKTTTFEKKTEIDEKISSTIENLKIPSKKIERANKG